MGPSKLADTLNISMEESLELFSLYATEFPTVNKWLDSLSDHALRYGFSVTPSPCKRKRYYPELKRVVELRRRGNLTLSEIDEIKSIEGQVRRNGGNSPIQGAGADICKEALIGVRELIMKYNHKYSEEVAFLVCTVHDAIDVEVREDLAERFSIEMADIMVKCGNKYVTKVTMAVDTTITSEWSK